MKLSLLFPAWYQEFGSFSHAARKVSTFPPLNLCVVAAIAEKAGWEVQLIDAHIENLTDQELVERVASFAPDLVGLTSTTPFFHTAESAATLLKQELGVPIAVGGTHVSICRQDAFSDCFDYLFTGECDLHFKAFLDEFASGNRHPAVPGVMMRLIFYS